VPYASTKKLNILTSYTKKSMCLALPLLVPGVGTDDAYGTATPDYLAVAAQLLY
jgi:hypothetical protein